MAGIQRDARKTCVVWPRNAAVSEIEDRSAMSVECFPITVLPHVSQIYRDYLAMAQSAADAPVRRWYGAEPFAGRWMGKPVSVENPGRLADALRAQSVEFGAGPAVLANIEKLRAGARAVVTGQQVG